MVEPAEKSRFLKKAYWAAQAFYLFYYLAALAALRQWGVRDPWTRLDRFSGGFLLLALLWTVADLRWHRTIFQSEPILREASGVSFDSGMLRVVAVLSVAELAVFLDYGPGVWSSGWRSPGFSGWAWCFPCWASCGSSGRIAT